MKLKDIFNIQQDIDESNIIIKEFSYYLDEEIDLYNLEISFSLYVKNPKQNNDSDEYLEYISNSKNLINKKILFKNVSNFSIKNVYRDMQITGFEILNHKENGWQKEIKYEVKDYEGDKINLFCEEIIVIK